MIETTQIEENDNYVEIPQVHVLQGGVGFEHWRTFFETPFSLDKLY